MIEEHERCCFGGHLFLDDDDARERSRFCSPWRDSRVDWSPSWVRPSFGAPDNTWSTCRDKRETKETGSLYWFRPLIVIVIDTLMSFISQRIACADPKLIASTSTQVWLSYYNRSLQVLICFIPSNCGIDFRKRYLLYRMTSCSWQIFKSSMWCALDDGIQLDRTLLFLLITLSTQIVLCIFAAWTRLIITPFFTYTEEKKSWGALI